jgi:pectate lyase
VYGSDLFFTADDGTHGYELWKVEGSGLGIEENESNNKVHIYPNPTNAQITLDSAEPIEELTIVTSMGQIVESIVNPKNTIDVAHLRSGVYFLQVKTNDGISSQRFIKN